jgi:hypothetical protein
MVGVHRTNTDDNDKDNNHQKMNKKSTDAGQTFGTPIQLRAPTPTPAANATSTTTTTAGEE